MPYSFQLFTAKLRRYFSSRERVVQTVIVFLLAVVIPLSVVVVQKTTFFRPKADDLSVRLFFAPETQAMPPEKTFQVMLDAKTNKAAFVQTEIVFDPAKVQLTRTPILGDKLKKNIFQTDLAQANQTGRMKLAVGLEPADVSAAPTQIFLVATLSFRSNTTLANQSANLAFSSDKTSVVTLDERAINPTVGGATVALNQTAPSPTPSATPTSTPASAGQPGIDRMVLVNTESKAEIQTLNTSQLTTLNYQQLPKFTLKAIPKGTVGSVKFVYKPDYRTHANPAVVDNTQPFTIVCDGGTTGWICPWDVGVGSYEISVTPYSETKGKGTAGETLKFTVKVIDNNTATTTQPSPTPSPTPPTVSIQKIDMIDIANGSVIKTLNTSELTTIKLSDYPNKYTLKAVVPTSTVGSVKFVYKADYRSEANPAVLDSTSPFTIVCDGGSSPWICPWDVGVGRYDISVTPYAQINGQGQVGSTLNFSVKVE